MDELEDLEADYMTWQEYWQYDKEKEMDDLTHEEMKQAYKMVKDALCVYRTSNEELCETYDLEGKNVYAFIAGYMGSTLEFLERMFEEEWLKLKE